MSIFEKFFKNKKGDLAVQDESQNLSDKIILNNEIDIISHNESVLEDGRLYDTSKAEKVFSDPIIQVSPQSITDAISVLRHELLQHGEIYHGFKASLKSALERYNYCGLPFEPEEEIAEKILNFMIGEEQ